MRVGALLNPIIQICDDVLAKLNGKTSVGSRVSGTVGTTHLAGRCKLALEDSGTSCTTYEYGM